MFVGAVEGSRPGEQPRKSRKEEERLLTTHAATEREHPMTIDVQPGDGMLRDRTHSREVANLPGSPHEKSVNLRP